MTSPFNQLVAVVPAAGVGKRMKANCPKQYLKLHHQTVIEHTVFKLLQHPRISQVIVAVSKDDAYFADTALVNHPDVIRVDGGKERVDSVLSALKAVDKNRFSWALVHDAARPCLTLADISSLIEACEKLDHGGILAAPVRDTMKRTNAELLIEKTESRELLWHALTPQMFPVTQLILAIEDGAKRNALMTDESSAIELLGLPSQIVSGRSDNIKITHPDDLEYAEFILSKQR